MSCTYELAAELTSYPRAGLVIIIFAIVFSLYVWTKSDSIRHLTTGTCILAHVRTPIRKLVSIYPVLVIREMCGDFLETILKAGVQARFCHWTSTPPNNPAVYVTILYQDTELYRCSFGNHTVLWSFIWTWYRPNLDGRLAVCWEWDTTGPVLIPRMGH